MTTEEQNIQLSDDVEIIGPGQLLKEARIEKGLSQEQVADRLNLRLSFIQSVESEQFDPKMPETFMRGYLKSYANLLGINPADISSSYTALDVAHRQGHEMMSFSQSKKRKAENNLLMLATSAFVIVLIALTVGWWLQNSDNDQVFLATNTEQPELNTAVNSEATTTNNEVISTNTPIVNRDIEQQDVDSETRVTDSQLPAMTLLETSTEPSTTDTNSTTLNELSTDKVTPVIDGENPLAELVFSFKGDCWVNIFDASGERLAWGIKKADYLMTLNGIPPFTITLGKPELVEIAYNQDALDMDQFQKGQIAKFTWPIL